MRIHMKNLICLAVVILLLMSLSGCAQSSDSFGGIAQWVKSIFGASSYPTVPAIVETGKAEKPSGVDIYWDATLSMRGYAVPPGQTLYRRLPDNMESIGATLSGTAKVAFYKFGKEVTRLEGREHRRITDPDFYNETITAINKVIDTANPDNLSIVVTDLFESDADWVNIAQKISDKYLANRLAVAVVGLRNPFDGFIYDVGMSTGQTRDVFYYASGSNDRNKFRPLYLIIMGPQASVSACLDRMVQNNIANEQEMALFSHQITRQFPTLAQAGLENNQNIQIRNRLESRKLIDANVKEFSIKNRHQVASYTAKINYEPAMGSPIIDFSKLDAQVGVKKSVHNQLVEEVTDLGANVKVVPGYKAGKIVASISFTPGQFLTKGAWYLIDVKIVPKAESIQLPPWINEWDMHVDGIALTPHNFNGATTVNLYQFMNGLKNVMMEVDKPQLGRILMVLEG